MVLEYLPNITDKTDKDRIFDILCDCDNEFVPRLSARDSTSGKIAPNCVEDIKPYAYFDQLIKQSFILVYDKESGKMGAFLSFKKDYSHEYDDVMYISTLCVAKEFRGRGILHKLYDETDRLAKKLGFKNIMTRTWSTHDAQIKTLEKHGFNIIKAIENDRGSGIGTVYFNKNID